MSLSEVRVSEPLLALADIGARGRLRGSDAGAIRAAATELATDEAPVLSFHAVVACDDLAVQNGIAEVVRQAWYDRGQVANVVGAGPGVAAALDRGLRQTGLVAWADDGRLLGASAPLSQALEACQRLGRFSLSAFRRLVPVSEIAAENRIAMLVQLDAVAPTGRNWQLL